VHNVLDYIPNDFRRPRGLTNKLAIEVPRELHDQLVELVQLRHTSVATELRRAIRLYVEEGLATEQGEAA
jgi:hypothetical protein